ncbi:MAG TPA: hypothetical protein VNJ52_05090 [Patescibacteria group bacterium]|nr:hypothetical protein [Patescibacteria group bacterium]
MTIEQAIKKAIEGGWKDKWDLDPENRHGSDVFLDPSFWQSLGKALGWGENDTAHRNEWISRWHDFIDHLAEGKSAESFFETLT